MNKRIYKVRPTCASLLFRDAMGKANHVYVDEIPEGGIRRVPSDKGIDWAFDHILKSRAPHLTCFERTPFALGNGPGYIEFAMSTMGPSGPSNTEYFLWVCVPVNEGEGLIKKYELEQIR